MLLVCSIDTSEACADNPLETLIRARKLRHGPCVAPPIFSKQDIKSAFKDYDATPKVRQETDVLRWWFSRDEPSPRHLTEAAFAILSPPIAQVPMQNLC